MALEHHQFYAFGPPMLGFLILLNSLITPQLTPHSSTQYLPACHSLVPIILNSDCHSSSHHPARNLTHNAGVALWTSRPVEAFPCPFFPLLLPLRCFSSPPPFRRPPHSSPNLLSVGESNCTYSSKGLWLGPRSDLIL